MVQCFKKKKAKLEGNKHNIFTKSTTKKNNSSNEIVFDEDDFDITIKMNNQVENLKKYPVQWRVHGLDTKNKGNSNIY